MTRGSRSFGNGGAPDGRSGSVPFEAGQLAGRLGGELREIDAFLILQPVGLVARPLGDDDDDGSGYSQQNDHDDDRL